MKIAVVGCGAVGSFYGAKLLAGGHETHFLLRSDYETVSKDGVRVQSAEGNFHIWPRPAIHPEEIGPCDLVLIGLKTTANDQFAHFLPPLTGASTLLLTLQNGLGNELQLAQLFGEEGILGGLCFVCLNRTQPGVIHHLAHGHVTLGEFRKPAMQRTYQLAETFRHARVSCDVTDDLERAHWEKLVWNIPFNGLGVASAAGYEAVVSGHVPIPVQLRPCLTTETLLRERPWEKLVSELMREVIATANALGFPLPMTLADENMDRTRIMGAYKPSTVIDFERGHRIELESLFLRPLACAIEAGIAAPRLAALCEVLSVLDRTIGLARQS